MKMNWKLSYQKWLSSPWVDRFRRKPAWWGGGAALLFVLLWLAWPRTDVKSRTSFHEVQRDNLLVSIVEGGAIEAVNEEVIRSEVDGTARIIYLVPEGTYVKQGDLLVELDSSDTQDRVNQQEINYEQARFALVMAKEQLAIQKISGEGDEASAELKLELVETDLQRFLEGQAPQQKRNLENDIQAAHENLLVAQERLDWSEKLHAKGYETKSNLDRDRLTVSQYKARLAQTEQALWIFDTFDFVKQKRQLESSVEYAKRDLQRTKLQANRRLSQIEADVTAQETTVDLSLKKLERDKAKLAACKILAPQDGLVVYAGDSHRSSSESPIEEGATVRTRQEIIKLPDVSQMKLVVRVHEAYINMITAGLPAFVVLDARPDLRFRGVVQKVAILPDPSRWNNPNLKVYSTEILITDPMPDVKPGVSARAEIVITNLTNVLSVPLQAVTTHQGQQVAYLAKGRHMEPVPISVGLYNTKMIQVLSGLKEGDRVSLSPPLDSAEKMFGSEPLAPTNSTEMGEIKKTVIKKPVRSKSKPLPKPSSRPRSAPNPPVRP